jgi:hypothetical protein
MSRSRNPFDYSDLEQIFSPIAVCIAYFSMPTTVTGFVPSRTAFFSAMFLIMLCLRLLLDVYRGQVDQTWWWKAIVWWTHKFAACLPGALMKSRHGPADPDPEGIGPHNPS